MDGGLRKSSSGPSCCSCRSHRRSLSLPEYYGFILTRASILNGHASEFPYDYAPKSGISRRKMEEGRGRREEGRGRRRMAHLFSWKRKWDGHSRYMKLFLAYVLLPSVCWLGAQKVGTWERLARQ